jgi:hypothetical protein
VKFTHSHLLSSLSLSLALCFVHLAKLSSAIGSYNWVQSIFLTAFLFDTELWTQRATGTCLVIRIAWYICVATSVWCEDWSSVMFQSQELCLVHTVGIHSHFWNVKIELLCSGFLKPFCHLPPIHKAIIDDFSEIAVANSWIVGHPKHPWEGVGRIYCAVLVIKSTWWSEMGVGFSRIITSCGRGLQLAGKALAEIQIFGQQYFVSNFYWNVHRTWNNGMVADVICFAFLSILALEMPCFGVYCIKWWNV